MCSKWLIGSLLGLALWMSACNPFAPAFDPDGLEEQSLLGDRTTIDGLFEYFKNSYEIRDTSLYGQLFSSDFTFIFYDFDQAAQLQWDKGQEMASAYNLFRQVRQITLDWNFYVEQNIFPDSAIVVRNFNLSIVEDENTTFVGTGRAKLKMRRTEEGAPWKIYYWFDDSDF